MSSSKKRQSTRKIEAPDWAADVKPSEDVMAMFYAPTGQPKLGPLIPLAQPNSTTATQSEVADADADLSQPSQAEDESQPEADVDELSIGDQSTLAIDLQSQSRPSAQAESAQAATQPGGDLKDFFLTEVDEGSIPEPQSSEPVISPEVYNERASRISGRTSDEGSSIDERMDSVANGAAVFEEYFGQWRPFLTVGQAKILRALFEMTYAIGQSECLTSTSRLASAAGMSERQTSAIARDLEKLGFIARPETFNTRTKKGTVFQLFLSRQSSPSGTKRRYHFED
jgi:hypothetical protein